MNTNYFTIISINDFKKYFIFNEKNIDNILSNIYQYNNHIQCLSNECIEVYIEYVSIIDNIPIRDSIVLLFNSYETDIDIYHGLFLYLNKQISIVNVDIIDKIKLKDELEKEKSIIFYKIKTLTDNSLNISNEIILNDCNTDEVIEFSTNEINENNTDEVHECSTNEVEECSTNEKYLPENKTQTFYKDNYKRALIEFIRRPKAKDYYWRAKFIDNVKKINKTKSYNLNKYSNEQCIQLCKIWLKEICSLNDITIEI